MTATGIAELWVHTAAVTAAVRAERTVYRGSGTDLEDNHAAADAAKAGKAGAEPHDNHPARR